MTYVVGKGLALAPTKLLVLSEWPQSDWQCKLSPRSVLFGLLLSATNAFFQWMVGKLRRWLYLYSNCCIDFGIDWVEGRAYSGWNIPGFSLGSLTWENVILTETEHSQSASWVKPVSAARLREQLHVGERLDWQQEGLLTNWQTAN